MSRVQRILGTILLLSVGGTTPGHAIGGAQPADAAGAARAAARPHHVYVAGYLLLTRPWIDADDAEGNETPGYIVIDNRSGSPDRLTGASIAGAGAVTIEGADGEAAAGGLTVPANGRLVLQQGGAHLLVRDLKAPATKGAPVGGTLTFARSGTVHLSFLTDQSAADEDDQSAPADDHPVTLRQ